jgi:hypothetical protein
VQDTQELDPRASGDPQLSAALKSFEALSAESRLQFLALLGDQSGRTDDGASPQAAGGEPAESQSVPAMEAPAEPTAPELPNSTDAAPILLAPLDAVPEQSVASGAEPVPNLALETPTPTAMSPPPPPSAAATAGLAKIQIVESAEFAQQGRRILAVLRNTPGRPGSFPTVSILVTMVCSFVLTLGVMLWHRQSDASASQRPLEAEVAPVTPPSPSPALRQAVAPPPLPPRVPANAQQDHGETSDDLPIELSFRRRPVASHPESFDRSDWQVSGRLRNLSDEAMAIDISVEGEQGTSFARVMIDPSGDAEFGPKDGLEIHPNDRIRLHSSPYADLVSQVR